MKPILTAICTIVSITIFAQTAPHIQRQKCFGGTDQDDAYSIQQTTDGGYIIAGTSASNDDQVTGNHGGYYDYWIVKLKNNGIIQWEKSLGGSDYDQANSIQQTTDGGYIVAGYSYSNDGDVSGNHGLDYWIVKLDTIGNIQWQKCLGGSGIDVANSIQQTTDGGYIVAGYSNSNDGDVSDNHGGYYDYWIVKLKKNGAIQWQKCLGGSGLDEAKSIQQTKDGGYIVAGWSDSRDGDVTSSGGDDNYWIVKLKKNGDIQWEETLGGPSIDEANSIQHTTDGGYIVAGMTTSGGGDVTGFHGYVDYWIVKLTKHGNIQWQKCLGGSDWDEANSIRQTTDGGYIVAGWSRSNNGDVSGNHGSDDYWIVKVNKEGDFQWQKCLGGSELGQAQDQATSIQQTTDGGYIIAGWSGSYDGDVTGNHGGGADYWIVKLSKDSSNSASPEATTLSAGIQNKNAAQTKNNSKDFTVYPNPAKDVLHIQTNGSAVFSLINSSGKIVLTEPVNGSSSISISALSAGNYYLENNTTGMVQKVVVER